MYLLNGRLAIKMGKLFLRTCCALLRKSIVYLLCQSNQTLFKRDVQCLTIKCFTMPHTSNTELFTLCVMLNVDDIVQREL